MEGGKNPGKGQNNLTGRRRGQERESGKQRPDGDCRCRIEGTKRGIWVPEEQGPVPV